MLHDMLHENEKFYFKVI